MSKVAASAAALLLSGCSFGLCGNDLIEELPSPDGAYLASVFERNYGATAPYVRVVSLSAAEEDFDPERDEDWILTIEGQPNVAVTWLSENTLAVNHGASGERFLQRTKWREVNITFR